MSNVIPLFPPVGDVYVPEPLRKAPTWLCWRYESHPGEAKPRKVPVYANGQRRHGRQGSPHDLEQLVTFEEARDAAVRRGFDGIGLAHVYGGGIITLDFDNCVVDGVVRADVLALVRGTYAEYSPSGKGIHATFFGPPDLVANYKHKATSDDDFSVEAFSSSGFVTFTGLPLDHVELLHGLDYIAPLPDHVAKACHERFAAASDQRPVDPDDFMAGHEPKLGLSVPEIEKILSHLDPGMGRDQWIRVGMALHHETEGDDTGFELWDEWSSRGYNYKGTEDLRYQWERMGPVPGRRSVTMASVIHMAKERGYEARKTLDPEEVLAKAESMEPKGRFAFETAADIAKRPPPEWLIKNVLPKGELTVLYGPSGSGKSFIALDQALAIARGVDWFGNRTLRGNVAIVAAEGGGGLSLRLRAYEAHHGVKLADIPNLHFLTASPNLFEGDDDIAELIAELLKIGPLDVLQIDTLAQVSPGANENTSEDMGRVLSNIKLMYRATKATPQVVHHSGKDASKGSRGWSGLKGAADSQLEVIKHEGGVRELLVEKMKDGRDGLRFPFKLETVDLGCDRDGDPINSCVVVPADPPRAEEVVSKGKRRGRVEAHVLEIMATFGAADVVTIDELVEQAVAAFPPPEPGERDTRRQRVVRALENMSREKDGPLKIIGGRVIFYE
jgi:hypothetical protein